MTLRGRGLGRASAVICALALVAVAVGYLAWTPGDDAASGRAAPALSEPDEETANARAQSVLGVVAEALTQYPPTPDPPADRREALAGLDAVLQEPGAARRPAVQQFFRERIERALRDMHRTEVSSGATVWHIYNHGFVVRTASSTLCFDLVRAKYLPGFALPESMMREIVQECDVLFVSHVHADHAESFVAQTFVDQGKPVVAPAQVGYRDPLFEKVTHFEESAHKIHSLPIRQGQAILRVVVFPGHQGSEIDNNVVLVTTPDGISVAHTGDQWHVRDFRWIDRVARRFNVDILLPNDWTYDIARMVSGFDPAVVIPGHANELGHDVAKRQPYALSFQRKSGGSRFGGNDRTGYSQPLVVMAWGESYHYEPSPAMQRRPQRGK